MPVINYTNQNIHTKCVKLQVIYTHNLLYTSKTLFIVPTDTHYYKIIEMLKQFKIIILAPTCFGSRTNHHQGAISCLAKTTNMILCARSYGRDQCHGGNDEHIESYL